MLPHLRALRGSLAAPVAALLALGFLVSSPGVPTEWESGASENPASPVAHASHNEESGHIGHQGPEGGAAGHGSDQHDADHGCEGCFCVAATGCAAPAVSSQGQSLTSTPPSPHVRLLQAEAVPGRLLHQDIFRPPRAA
jgi:hypothetical protein